MADQLEEKQRYLCQQIIDRNYDAEQFAEYCQGTVGNVDLQVWTYAELRNIVKGFLNKKKEDKQSPTFKGEGSSFMKYQQEKNQVQDIDIDSIDVNQVQQSPMQHHNQNIFTKAVNTVDEMFKNPFGSKDKQTKAQDSWSTDMWKTISSPVVSLNINNFNFGGDKKQTNKVDEFDVFGDFSTPANYSKTDQPKVKPIAKPPTSFKSPIPKIVNAAKPIVSGAKEAIKNIIPQQNFSIFDLVIDTKPIPVPQKTTLQTNKPIPTMAELAQSMSGSLQMASPRRGEIDPTSVRLKAKLDGPNLVKQDFFDNISCIKAKVRHQLSDPTLTVQVTGHQIANRSYMLPSYVLYTIETKPLNIQVKRKYAYFQKLRLVLSKFYPGIRLPYLQKGAWISQTSPELIKNQKQIIQGFLNDILLSKQLKNCRIVEQFLTLKDKDGLRKKFAQYQKMDSLKNIEQLCLLRGSVDVAYTNQHKIYFDQLSPFLQNIESGIQKYKTLMDKLSTHYAALIKTYTQIQQTFATMQNNAKHFNSHVNLCECYDLERSIKMVGDYYKELNNNVRFEAKILEKQYKPFWNYQGNNINTIQQILDIRAKMTDTYSKNYTESSNRNDVYLNNRKLEQYKIGISEVSKHPAVLKYQVGFYNQAAAEQTMRLFNDLSKKINHKIVWLIADKNQIRLKQLEEFFKAQKRFAVNI